MSEPHILCFVNLNLCTLTTLALLVTYYLCHVLQQNANVDVNQVYAAL